MVFRILFTAAVFIISTVLFRAAAGSLKFTKLNMISTIFYFLLVFNLIGGSLIYIGIREHYLIQKIHILQTIDTTYYALAYCMIVFPLTLLFIKKMVTVFVGDNNTVTFVRRSINYNSRMINIEGFVVVLMLICTTATLYVFFHLGYIPVLSVLRGENLDVLRQSGSRNFGGNQYIKNLLMSVLTPMVSYYAYIYYRMTRGWFWRFCFFYMAALSVIVLTYDFSKSPIITYLLGLYLVEVATGHIVNSRRFILLISAAVLIILSFYILLFNVGSAVASIYTGPLGRILFTQVATLFLHTEAFPYYHEFLHGASFNGWMSFLFPAAEGVRSGRVVMEIYNVAGVQAGTAGVMNTVFIGEAYANYGMIGFILAPIVFGIIIGLFAYLIPSAKKTPVSILFYVQMTLQFTTIVEGGFVDIFYSASTVFIIIVVSALALMTCFANAEKKTTVQLMHERAVAQPGGRLKNVR